MRFRLKSARTVLGEGDHLSLYQLREEKCGTCERLRSR